MKILVLFTDMLRANLLNSFNSEIRDGPMDAWFKRLGGISYTNCYTPGADSPRGLASFLTGLYPKNNGCCMRSHWPKNYMKDVLTMFDLVNSRSYKMIVEINKNEFELGLLPNKSYLNMQVVHGLDASIEAVKNSIREENLFAFVGLDDYHWAMDDYGHSWMGEWFGQTHLANALTKFFSEINPEEFDYIFIFSDHGCKLNEEFRGKTDLHLLNDDRSKIVMFMHKKGDNVITKDNGITTIMDVFPTLNEILGGVPMDIDGISLLDPMHHDHAVMEDQAVFAPKINSVNQLWGFRNKDYFYLTSLDNSILLKAINDFKYETAPLDPNQAAVFNQIISDKSASYKEMKKLDNVLKDYQKLIVVGYRGLENTYSTGSRRVTNMSYVFKKPRLLAQSFKGFKKAKESIQDTGVLIKRIFFSDKYRRPC